jgi:hypothetical protein
MLWAARGVRLSGMRTSLLTNATLPTFLGAVLAILAVLTSMARVGISTGCREDIDFTDQKNNRHDLSENGNHGFRA